MSYLEWYTPYYSGTLLEEPQIPAVQKRRTGLYRYVFVDLRTDRVLAELPLSDVRYKHSLSAAGDFTATLDLRDDRVNRQQPIAFTEPGRTGVFIEADGAIVWGGIIWTRRYDSEARKAVFGGAEFSSYLDHVRIVHDLAYATLSQESIFAGLVGYANGRSDIGLEVRIPPTGTGVIRTREFKATDVKPVGTALRELEDEEPSFEWANEVYDTSSGSGYGRRMTMSYPTRGVAAATSALVWEYPGNVSGYSWDEDGSRRANLIWGISRIPSGQSIVAASVRWSDFAAGLPLLEDAVSGLDVPAVAQLQAVSDAELRRRRLPTDLKLRVREGAGFTVGDGGRVYIDDPPRFGADGFAGMARVIDIDISPRRNGGEDAVLTMELS